MKKINKTLCFITTLILSIHVTKIKSTPDPFSKIIITSNKAVCQKDKKKENIFLFSYLENVFVSFADNSTIQSDELEIELDTTNLKKSLSSKQTNTDQVKKIVQTPPSTSNLEQFKKITFKNNVIAKRTNRIVQAEKAELFLNQKICKLLGNVRIKQIKEKPKDFPMHTICNEAILNLENEQITFLGSSKSPVSTTIELAGHPSLMRKKKTKKQRRAEKKALKIKKNQKNKK